MSNGNDYYLYILMRTDLDSMNAGKAIAQGCHAANVFAWNMQNRIDSLPKTTTQPMASKEDLAHIENFRGWQEQAGEFGTTITLHGNINQIKVALTCAEANGYDTGIVIDPTYPIRDGQITHLISIETCGYVFARRSDVQWFMGHLELHP